jgi:hypothetical protein
MVQKGFEGQKKGFENKAGEMHKYCRLGKKADYRNCI